VAKNITDVGASRKQRVNGFDEVTLIAEGTFMGFRTGADPGSPGPDASKVTASVDAFVAGAEEVNQVSTPERRKILVCGLAHGRA
jgi:hypothetical protein